VLKSVLVVERNINTWGVTFPKPRDPTNLVGEEFNYEKWNAKAKNTLFRGLCKDVLYMKELEVSVRRNITLL
jgi:hypothetical protein